MNLPKDTQRNFSQHGNKSDNLSLWLDRFADPMLEGNEKLQFFKGLTSVLKARAYSQGLINAFYERSLALAQSLPHSKTFTASPEWRMVVGLGQASILETAMTLDRVTGIPIIPGSALKGLAASYALLCVLGKTKREEEVEKVYRQYLNEELDLEDLPPNFSEFLDIFGTQGRAGKVIFLDAVPTESPTLEPDIINCHYQDYYSDKTGIKSPTPYQNPIPVYFLTLGRKSKFAFAVAGRNANEETEKLVEKAKDWLCQGLQELGIGAKTAAGYGYLEVNKS